MQGKGPEFQKIRHPRYTPSGNRGIKSGPLFREIRDNERMRHRPVIVFAILGNDLKDGDMSNV